MEKMIDYGQLTASQLEQCENSLISIYEDMAADGDKYDKLYAFQIANNRKDRLDRLSYCKLYLQDDGYIFINL